MLIITIIVQIVNFRSIHTLHKKFSDGTNYIYIAAFKSNVLLPPNIKTFTIFQLKQCEQKNLIL